MARPESFKGIEIMRSPAEGQRFPMPAKPHECSGSGRNNRSIRSSLVGFRRYLWLLAILLAVGAWASAAEVPVTLMPVPAESVQAETRKTLKSIYKEEYARRKPEENAAFARTLLAQGKACKDDPIARYVFLREACDQAAKGGDVASTLEAIDALATSFAIVPREEKFKALSAVVTNVGLLSLNAIITAELKLVDEAITEDDYPFAIRVAAQAEILARRIKDPGQLARSKLLADSANELGEQYKLVDAAPDLLGEMTGESHARLGRFLCLYKGDWHNGLPHLAAGSDETLQALAAGESEAAEPEGSADSRVKVADGWYDYALKQHATAREVILIHADDWYRRVAPVLSGFSRLRIDKRIDELDHLLANSARRTVMHYPPGAALLMTFERETLMSEGGKLVGVLDVSGHGLRATATGVTIVSGLYGTALSFAGEAYLDLGNPKDLQITGSQTIAFWINPAVLNPRSNPFAKCYGGECTITLEPTGALNYFYGTAGSEAEPYMHFLLTDPIKAKIWTHVAVVRDLVSGRLSWYKNGKHINDGAAPYPAAAISTQHLFIGKGYTNPFCGLLDDVAVWPRALSEQEIAQLYQATVTGRQ